MIENSELKRISEIVKDLVLGTRDNPSSRNNFIKRLHEKKLSLLAESKTTLDITYMWHWPTRVSLPAGPRQLLKLVGLLWKKQWRDNSGRGLSQVDPRPQNEASTTRVRSPGSPRKLSKCWKNKWVRLCRDMFCWKTIQRPEIILL